MRRVEHTHTHNVLMYIMDNVRRTGTHEKITFVNMITYVEENISVQVIITKRKITRVCKLYRICVRRTLLTKKKYREILMGTPRIQQQKVKCA